MYQRYSIEQLQKAIQEMATGFERIEKLSDSEKADALREASAGLIEMRRACDDLAQQYRRRP